MKAAAARRAAKNRQENIERNTTENMAVTGNMKATVTKVAAKAAAAAGTITAGWNTLECRMRAAIVRGTGWEWADR